MEKIEILGTKHALGSFHGNNPLNVHVNIPVSKHCIGHDESYSTWCTVYFTGLQ